MKGNDWHVLWISTPWPIKTKNTNMPFRNTQHCLKIAARISAAAEKRVLVSRDSGGMLCCIGSQHMWTWDTWYMIHPFQDCFFNWRIQWLQQSHSVNALLKYRQAGAQTRLLTLRVRHRPRYHVLPNFTFSPKISFLKTPFTLPPCKWKIWFTCY